MSIYTFSESCKASCSLQITGIGILDTPFVSKLINSVAIIMKMKKAGSEGGGGCRLTD